MDQELKQRLIGASVIIALAIIFVPMLFDGEVEKINNQNISINIPDEGKNNLEIKKFELDKPVAQTNEVPAADVELIETASEPILADKSTANQTSENSEAVNSNDIQSAEDDSSDSSSVVVIDKDPAPQTATIPQTNNNSEPQVVEKVVEKVVESRPQPKPITTGINQVFRVKLGSFSQQGNAEKVKSSLLQKNIKAIVEYNPGLKLYRVWSQELYQQESKANAYVKAVNQLKLNIGTPKVVTLSADEVSQMASQGQMGWVIQLGSFSSKANAIELRNKVKAAGFNGFVDTIYNNKGVQLYRLRIGPLMQKTDAETTKISIKQKLKLEGLIKAHELGQIID